LLCILFLLMFIFLPIFHLFVALHLGHRSFEGVIHLVRHAMHVKLQIALYFSVQLAHCDGHVSVFVFLFQICQNLGCIVAGNFAAFGSLLLII